MSYRDDLAALTARHAALETEVAYKTRELDRSARLLEEARARASLPVLDNIRVASPCSAEWSKMTGDERVRHCGDCNKNVYNLSDMTRDEAQALIIAKEGRLCVRYFQRTDGTILLKDCAIGRRRRRRRRVIVAGATVLLAAGGAAGWKLWLSGEDAPEVARHELLGEVTAGVAAFDPPPAETQPAPEPAQRQIIEVKGRM